MAAQKEYKYKCRWCGEVLTTLSCTEAEVPTKLEPQCSCLPQDNGGLEREADGILLDLA